MLYTREWVLDKYNECNEKYFGGKLPKIALWEIKLTKNKHPWGRGGCRQFVKNLWSGEYEAKGVYLELSNYYDTSEKGKLEVLVHEMCHIYEYFVEPKYYIECVVRHRWTYDHPRHGHGTVFYEQAQRLEKYGFHVQRFVDNDTRENAEVSDAIAQRHQERLESGVHVLKLKNRNFIKGYQYGYVVLGKSNYQEWINYATTTEKFVTVIECITHDKKILAYPQSRGLGRYFLVDGPFDNVLKSVIFDSEKVIRDDENKQPENKPEKPITDLGAFLYGNEGNPHIKAAQKTQEPLMPSNKKYTFSIPVLSNGKPDYFTITNKTEEEAKKMMKERFPKWSDEIINEKFKKYTAMKESIELTDNDLKEIVEQVVERVRAARDKDDELKAAIANMPDEIPGHIDIN